MTYKILFLGDIVGRPGRQAVFEALPSLVSQHRPLFVIVNGENAAAGHGITPEIADELFAIGVDAITLGNHAFNKKEIYEYLNSDKPIVRPGNLPDGVPGTGTITVKKDGIQLWITNACGRVYMDGYDNPFLYMDEVHQHAGPHWFVDFHAEATSEKVAMGWHLNGRASVVVGTHTHVQTADERILPGRTAYITDAGMSGPETGVIGVDRDIILGKFRTSMPARFDVAPGPGVVCGIVAEVERDNGRAASIQRVRFVS